MRHVEIWLPKKPGCSASDISCDGDNEEQNNECPALEVVGQRKVKLGLVGVSLSPGRISSCVASETSFGCEVCEHNSECRGAIEVTGRIGHARSVALFLEDWELGRVALSCHMTMDVLCRDEGFVLG